VIENLTVETLYEAPVMLERNNFSEVVCRELQLDLPQPDLKEWNEMLERVRGSKYHVKIGLVGKYVKLHDAYLSVAEAMRHAGYENSAVVDIEWIDSEVIDAKNVAEKLAGLDGIVLPGGFGVRGVEGMIQTAKYARENNIPYLGLCLGMQIAVIEFARNAAGLFGANSGVFDENSPHKVIDFMPDQYATINKGGTMRLGTYPCKVMPGSLLEKCYGQSLIHERHRHRYEFNNDYRDRLSSAGLVLSGVSPDERIVETVELKDHPFYIGVQFHPEFKSRPNRAHPLFKGFVASALKNKK
jgi:CTP synthase